MKTLIQRIGSENLTYQIFDGISYGLRPIRNDKNGGIPLRLLHLGEILISKKNMIT